MLSDSPPDRDLEWSDSGIEGSWRYIGRLWRMALQLNRDLKGKSLLVSTDTPVALQSIKKQIHKTIKGVTQDLEQFHLNKAVARIRELSNALSNLGSSEEELVVIQEGLKAITLLIQPMVPHLSEAMWQVLGHKDSVLTEPWPIANKIYLQDDVVTIAVQFNGKLRATIELAKDASKEEAEKQALALESIQSALRGCELRKVIVVPNRIVNVVAG
jgi:leucyl-tRNA synthetase